MRCWGKRLTALFLLSLWLAGCRSLPPESGPVRALHAAYPSEADLGDVPSLMALDLLAEQGYEVTTTFFSGTDLAAEALSRGDAQVGAGSVEVFWSAVEQGADIVTIMEQVRNTWTLVSTNAIEQCADIDGKRLALTSEGSGSAALTRAYIDRYCPGTEYEVVLISGSSNRAAALLAGQVDVTPLELIDAQRIEQEAPGQVRVLARFADELPDMMVTGIYANREFAEANPSVVEDYLRAVLNIHQQIEDNPDLLVQRAAEVLGQDPAELTPIIQAHLDFDAWPTDGGLTGERFGNSLAFYLDTGDLSTGLTPGDIADERYLQAVLDE